MILIIDDDVAVRASLSLLFKQNGYQTKEAASAKEALQLAEKHTLQLVVMDMNFSIDTTGHDGLELLAKFKKLMPQVPVILITGWGSINLAVEGMRLGAADFITKPWSNDYLIQAVKTSLSLSQQSPIIDEALTRKKLDEQYNFSNIIGQDPKIVKLL